MEKEVLFQLALVRATGIGPVYTKILFDQFGSAEAIFKAGKKALARAKIQPGLMDSILNFKDWAMLEKELDLLEKKGVQTLFYKDAAYPQRLLDSPGYPPLLFYKGNADLNTKKIVAVVGTREASDYGRQITEQLIRQLARPDLLLISGLAYGIDACAHSAALKYNIPTVGVLGHGFAHIYPHQNKALASAMLSQGGLLTSFGLSSGPDRHHFPIRNRIVARWCDVLVVVETGRKGGSLITVEKAREYGKKIFAVPGRLSDHRSSGCNMLIQEGKAELLFSGQQLLSAMGWEWPAGRAGTQANLPFQASADGAGLHAGDGRGLYADDRTRLGSDGTLVGADAGRLLAAGGMTTGAGSLSVPVAGGLPAAERQLMQLLTKAKDLSVDELTALSRLEVSTVALHLLNLELQGLINAMPGKRYRLSYNYVEPAA